MFPSWYAKPPKDALKAGGEISPVYVSLSQGEEKALTKIDRNHTPCSLDSRLDEESTSCQSAKRAGKDPERDPARGVAQTNDYPVISNDQAVGLTLDVDRHIGKHILQLYHLAISLGTRCQRRMDVPIMAPTLLMMVALEASKLENPFVVWR